MHVTLAFQVCLQNISVFGVLQVAIIVPEHPITMLYIYVYITLYWPFVVYICEVHSA